MGLPYIFASNFEQGDASEWDSQNDVGSQMDFPHYSTLAGIPGMEVPYSGAYCMRTQLNSTTASLLVESDVAIADGSTGYVRFNFYMGTDFDGSSTNDNIVLLQLTGGGSPSVKATVSIGWVASAEAYRFRVGDNTADQETAWPVEQGKWYTLELETTVSTLGSGVTSLYITPEGAAARATADLTKSSITHAAAVSSCNFGPQQQNADNGGTMLFDNFAFDNERPWPEERFTDKRLMWKSGHAFLGNGTLESLSMVSTTAATEVRLYDTDAYELRNDRLLGVLRNPTADQTGDLLNRPIDFRRGCYAAFSDAADPRALIVPLDAYATLKASRATGCMSKAGIRNLARTR